MLKSIAVIFGLVAVASSGLVLPQPKISCDECTREMHALAAVIRQFAPEMEVRKFHKEKIYSNRLFSQSDY